MFKPKQIIKRLKEAHQRARDCVIPERSLELLMEAIEREIHGYKTAKVSK